MRNASQILLRDLSRPACGKGTGAGEGSKVNAIRPMELKPSQIQGHVVVDQVGCSFTILGMGRCSVQYTRAQEKAMRSRSGRESAYRGCPRGPRNTPAQLAA
eukprot:gene12876-biopygen1818